MRTLSMAEEWRKQDKKRRAPESAEHWNMRAATYAKGAHSGYVERFIDKMRLSGRELIFDMGCGTGSLAVQLAKRDHGVIAADFSSGMLEQLRRNVETAKVPLFEPRYDDNGALCVPESGSFVIPLEMSWEDDWTACGIMPGCVDVAIASRSIITHDLENSLSKLSEIARERVCVTVGTGVSPRVDPVVAKAMGVHLALHNDALFVFGIAHELGFEPEVSYIHSPRTRVYASRDDAYHTLLGTMDYVDDHAEQVDSKVAAQRLREWLSIHLVEDERSGTWHLDEPHMVPWAFISWKVR